MTTVRYIPHKCHRCFNDIVLVVREGANTMKRLIPVMLMLILMSTPVYADDFQDGEAAFGDSVPVSDALVGQVEESGATAKRFGPSVRRRFSRISHATPGDFHTATDRAITAFR